MDGVVLSPYGCLVWGHQALVSVDSCCSVTKSYLTLCNPVGYNMSVSPIFHYLLQSMIRLMVNSKITYVKGSLPWLLFPVPLSPQKATADPHLTEYHPTPASRPCSVSCGVTAPFPWVLAYTKIFLYSPRVEFLLVWVLWKPCNHISLTFKVRFFGDS